MKAPGPASPPLLCMGPAPSQSLVTVPSFALRNSGMRGGGLCLGFGIGSALEGTVAWWGSEAELCVEWPKVSDEQ